MWIGNSYEQESWHLRIGMIIFLRVLLVDPFLREMIMAACMMIDSVHDLYLPIQMRMALASIWCHVDRELL
jgi:type III secretory pathway component EscR